MARIEIDNQAGIIARVRNSLNSMFTEIYETISGTEEKHMDFSVLLPGATPPALVAFGDYYYYVFDVGEDVHIHFDIPHDWDGTSNFQIEVAWAINEAYAASSGEVQWRADWSATPVGESFVAPAHTGQLDSGDINIPAVAITRIDSEIGSIPGASLVIDDCVGIRVSRIAIDAGANPVQDPAIACIHIHYYKNKP